VVYFLVPPYAVCHLCPYSMSRYVEYTIAEKTSDIRRLVFWPKPVDVTITKYYSRCQKWVLWTFKVHQISCLRLHHWPRRWSIECSPRTLAGKTRGEGYKGRKERNSENGVAWKWGERKDGNGKGNRRQELGLLPTRLEEGVGWANAPGKCIS